MAIPKNKEELIAAIKGDYSKLKEDLKNIPSELTIKKELQGHAKGSLMSLSNLVAYLIGWGELVLKWNRKINNGEVVDFPETGYKWNELGSLAQKFYADYENTNYTKLLDQLDCTVNTILTLVRNTKNAELYEQAWYKQFTKGRMIQLNTSSPYKNARIRVRKWKKQKQAEGNLKI